MRNLSNTHQAIGLLATHWRDAESRKQRSALRACRRATSGDLPPRNRQGGLFGSHARCAYRSPTGNGGQRPARQGTEDSVRTGRSP
ncbi:DUF982 domain-containing protein [Mesorhizobium australicum]|uniref:DUF982 domain-containing protein n=1 Tax=Mesorhizobium australicum TaxID=536018 RepID=A0ACC6SWS6_9HYPH